MDKMQDIERLVASLDILLRPLTDGWTSDWYGGLEYRHDVITYTERKARKAIKLLDELTRHLTSLRTQGTDK